MSLKLGFVSLVTENIQSSTKYTFGFDAFTLKKPLPMRLDFCVDHFLYQLSLSEDILVTGFLLVEKVMNSITQLNVHRIMFTCMALAYKFVTDVPVSNAALETIGCLRTGELAKLELKILEVVDWHFRMDSYEDVRKMLENAGKPQENQDSDKEKSVSFGGHETDFTEYDSGESFSELGAFF